jgi:hypothetical protein
MLGEVRGKSKKTRTKSSVPNYVYLRPHTKLTETLAPTLKKTRHHTERAEPWTEHFVARKMTVDDYPSPRSSRDGRYYTEADSGGKEPLRERRGSERRQPDQTRVARDRVSAASSQAEDRAPYVRHSTTSRRSLQRTIEPSAPTPAPNDARRICAGPSNQGNRFPPRFRHGESSRSNNPYAESA